MDSHKALEEQLKVLTAAAKVLELLFKKSPIVVGSSKQKPIEFYVEEAWRTLRSEKLFLIGLQIKLNCIESPDGPQSFEKAVNLFNINNQMLDSYLMFFTFLISQK